MTITAKLKLAALAPVVMALVILVALGVAGYTLNSVRTAGQKTQELLMAINEVNSLTHSYIMHREERPRLQFLAQQQAISELLHDLALQRPEQILVVDQMRLDAQLMHSLFDRLVDNSDRHLQMYVPELVEVADQRIAGQLIARARAMVSSALALDALVTQQLADTQHRVATLVIVLILGTTLPLTYLLFAMMHSIRQSLVSLRLSTDAVAAGDLHHRIRSSGTDELADLGRAFDNMTSRLQATTVSVDELQKEVEERKRAEAALRDAQERLKTHAADLERTVARRTMKLQETIEELEHFSYAIVHDLRAPLRAMQGFAALLEEECAANGELPLTRQYLRRIQNASHRMDQLIADALSYSKIAHGEVPIGPVDLQVVFEDLVATYPNLHPDKADIRALHRLPVVLGNEAGLTQCFSNLLGNAVKFTKPGEKPHVRVWSEEVEQDASQGSANRTLRVWIEDNGIGIPDAHQNRIFRMFQRATTDFEGTGIGLAIVKKVVQRIGGDVGVESTEGKGSRFWVLLRSVNGN